MGDTLGPFALLDELTDAVVVTDRSNRIRYANKAAGRLLGWAHEELYDLPLTELMPPRMRRSHQDGFSRYFLTNEPRIIGRPVVVPALHREGHEFDIELTLSVLDDGEQAGDHVVLGILRPKADLSATERPVGSFLTEVTALLATTIDYGATIANVAGLLVPALADWCGVDMLRDDGSVDRVIVTHADTGKAAAAAELRRYAPRPEATPDHPILQAMRTGRSVVYHDVPDEVLAAAAEDAAHLDLLRSLGVRSGVVVPLRTRGRVLGALTLTQAESGRRYTPEDVPLLEDIAARIALAVDNARLYDEARQAERRYRSLVEAIEGIVWEADPDTYRYVYVSPRAERLLGYPVEEWLRREDFWESIVLPEDRDRALDHCGEQLSEHHSAVCEYRVRTSDGEVRWLRDSVQLVRNDHGAAVQLRGLMVDVTDVKRQQEELEFQKALLESQSEASTEGILVVGPDGRWLSFNRRFVELWHIAQDVVVRGSDEEALASVLDQVVDRESFVRRVQQVYADRTVSRDEILLGDGRVFDRYGTPLVAEDGDYLGYAWYTRDVTEAKQSEQMLIEHRDRFARLARTLQESLLPPHLPNIPGLEVAARYRPAGTWLEIGGDFYDLFRTGRGQWGLVMGDVCGKGAEAAAVTALARYTVRAAAMQTRRPSRILHLLNDAVLRQRSGERFISVAYASLRRQRGRILLTVCSGGHPLPLIVRADGTVTPAGVPGGLIGLFKNVDLEDAATELFPGDTVVLYTDGVTDARSEDGELFGDERLVELLRGCAGEDAETVAARVDARVTAHQARVLHDDLALVVVRVM